jgi:hypothetical protein
MFTAEQYRAKAAEFGAFLANTPRSPNETREFRHLERVYTRLAENEEWMAVNIDKTVQRRKNDDNRTALADEEEQILKCLGAAVLMRWNTVPTKLQRELFDCASTIGDLQQTTPLKGQIARFLHNHKDDQQNRSRGEAGIEKGPQILSTQESTLMAPVACPKCSVVVYQTASGGWRFDPPTGCVDLEGTEWGAKGEFEWCPTLAVAMPDEVFWPGQSHRDHVMRVAERVQARAKTKAESSKKDSEN